MATTIGQVSQFLDENNITYDFHDDAIGAYFNTETYTDKDGDKGLLVVVRLEEDGEYIKIMAPRAYQVADSPHLKQVFQVLLMVSWRTKLVQFEYDHTDGEVRAIVEFPLEDAPLTATQLIRSINGLVGIVDEADPVIRAAIENGELLTRHAFFVDEDSKSLETILDEIGWDSGDEPTDPMDRLLREFREFLRQRGVDEV